MDLATDGKTKPVIGPICEKCGHPTDSVYPCYVKRERRGYFEMVKIYLCATHYFELLECDTENQVPPPPNDDDDDVFECPPPDDNEEEDDDDEEDQGGKGNIDREGQSFG
jgi:hypothetical protein